MISSLPKKMKAVVLHHWNDLRYEEVDMPSYGPQEVLCRVKGCGICATDVHMANGDLEGIYPPHLPFVMGHEWWGEVVAMGSLVEGFSLGQRVLGEPQKGCGKCHRCKEGRYHLCVSAPRAEKGYKLYGHNVNGAYADYVAVDAMTLFPIPDHFGMEEGVSACNVGIGVEAVRRARIRPGDDVVIFGIGLLGLIVLQLAGISGAGRTMAVGRGYRLRMASELGADIKIDRTLKNVHEQIMMLTNGEGADVVIECAGTPQAVQDALSCVKRGGRLVLVGISGVEQVPLDTDRIVLDEIELVGSRGAPNALAQSIQLISSGRINVKPLVTHQLPLSGILKGMEIFKKKLENVIRVALIP